MTLPPALAGIPWSQWQSWPAVNIGSSTYYQPPGRPDLLFDPNRGGANGLITSRQTVELNAGKAEATQAAIDQANNPPSPYMQAGQAVAGVGATALGYAGIHNLVTTGSIFGAGAGTTTPAVATPVFVGGGAPGTVLGAGAVPIGTTGGTTGTTALGAATAGTPAVEAGTATTGTAGSTTALGAAPLSAYVGPAAGIIGGLYTAKKTADYTGGAAAGGKRNVNSAAAGAAAGFMLGGPAGALLGAAAGGLGSSLFGSGKDKYQQARDQGRQYLKQAGLVDDKLTGTLADGSAYNFGSGGNLKDFDYKDPVTGEIIAQADLLAAAEGFTGRNLEAQAGIYAAAALSNAGGDINKAQENIKHFADQRKMTAGAVNDYLNKQLADGQLDESMVKVLQSKANSILPATLPAPGQPGTATFSPAPITTTNIDPGRTNPAITSLPPDNTWHPGMQVHIHHNTGSTTTKKKK